MMRIDCLLFSPLGFLTSKYEVLFPKRKEIAMASRSLFLSKRVRLMREARMTGRRALPLGLDSCPGYQLRECRGRGTFGEVWEAKSAEGARVALKFMECDGATAPREIRTLQQVRQLTHPHLLHIHKIFCHAGYLVLVMDLADGSLEDLLAVEQSEGGKALRAPRLCKYISQAAEVIDFLNTRQHRIDSQLVAFRHCDVKPSNLLLIRGVLKLADFGLTVMTSAVSQRQPPCGSTNYAAPEVFAETINNRTDQYSLAVSYFQLRTGQMPFPDSPPKFRRDYVRPAPDLSLLSANERPVVARALAPISVDRWASCGEFMAALTRAVTP
jgi:serine/threonine protein kinase